MKAFWSKLKEKWNMLAIRERYMLSVGAGVVCLFIVYEGLWKPYLYHVAFLREQITREQKILAWMQAADKTMQALEKHNKGKGKAVSIMALLGQIQKCIHQAGLSQNLTQLQQAPNETIEIHLQKIDFDKLMGFLTALEKTQAISIIQMSVSLNGPPGIVNADIVLNK